MGINNVNSNQINTLLNSMERKGAENKKEKSYEKNLEEKTKKDFLDLSSQIDIISKENSKITDRYAELESKLGIDSNKWGVEAVSDNIFEFTKVLYEKYKLDNDGADNQEILDQFYKIAKGSIQKGYDEAMNTLGALPKDVQELSKSTLDRSLEKLDNWYKNGGKEIENESADLEVPEENIENKAIEDETILEEKRAAVDEKINKMLEEAEMMKNEVLDLLRAQGMQINGKDEDETKINKIDISG